MASTNTTRYGLNKATPATAEPVAAGAGIWAAFDIIDLNLGARVCTSSTRPAAPITGMTIFETDKKAVRVYDALTSTWRLVNPIGDGQFLATTETTSSITYVDLATVGPAVTVFMTAGQRVMIRTKARQFANVAASAIMSYRVSGTETLTAAAIVTANGHEQETSNGAGDTTSMSESIFTASGADGDRTFTAAYRSGSAAQSTFRNRWISASLLSN